MPEVIEPACSGCHVSGGLADSRGSIFVLAHRSDPSATSGNVEVLRSVANLSVGGRSVLLQKPLGELGHYGGSPLTQEDPRFALLEDFVAAVERGDEGCEAHTGVEGALEKAQLLSPQRLLRRAAEWLVGRLPTDAERADVLEGGDSALPSLLDQMMREPAFLERVKEMFNDLLLTDKLKVRTSFLAALGTTTYPEAVRLLHEAEVEEQRRVNVAGAREPLELIAYLIEHDRPLHEMLTVDFTVINPALAEVYPSDVEFSPDATDDDWRPAHVMQGHAEGGLTPVPHAGIFTTPAWLNRVPTSTTNLSRHRAWIVLKQFLATDILETKNESSDVSGVESYFNPTRDDPRCSNCHVQLDPIAGGFMRYHELDQERHMPGADWHLSMQAPGFEGEPMPRAAFDHAARWLGEHVAEDPRFAVAMTNFVFEQLSGDAPLSYPTGIDVSPAALGAWELQQQALQQLAQAFVEAEYDFRVLLREALLHPYLRADGVAESATELQRAVLAPAGVARLLTPEELSRRIGEVLGYGWRDNSTADPFETDFRVLYGGIDSDAVITRWRGISAPMVALQVRMALEVACAIVPFELGREPAERRSLPSVLLGDVAAAAGGNAAAEDRMRSDIAWLLDRAWGPAEDDAARVDAAYTLLLSVAAAGREAIAEGEIDATLPEGCEALREPETRKVIRGATPMDDPQFEVRALTALLSHVLGDYRFTHF